MKLVFKKIIVAIITWQAKTILKKYNPKIVAVTGSVGKTSTKDAVEAVLSKFFYTRASPKSFNSEIGVPLTILGRPNAWGSAVLWLKNIIEGFALIILPNQYPEWLILEVGADRPGDIESITRWIKPDISVVTRIAKVPVHIEYFRSVGEIIKEKSFLVLNTKRDGFVILNCDDEDVLNFANLVQNTKIFYGHGSKADVRGSNLRVHYDKKRPVGMMFNVSVGDEQFKMSVNGALGAQQMYPALAALSVAKSLNLSIESAIESYEDFKPAPGRMKIIDGIKETTIIDDSYNSSPVALEEALKLFGDLKTEGRKIAILGDMLELGIYSADEHKKAGALAGGSSNILVTSGLRARHMAEGALNAGMHENNIFQFDNSQEAGKFVETLLQKGDVILIKGSQGARMEFAVEEIMAKPENKEKLLVRQEKEWQNR